MVPHVSMQELFSEVCANGGVDPFTLAAQCTTGVQPLEPESNSAR